MSEVQNVENRKENEISLDEIVFGLTGLVGVVVGIYTGIQEKTFWGGLAIVIMIGMTFGAFINIILKAIASKKIKESYGKLFAKAFISILVSSFMTNVSRPKKDVEASAMATQPGQEVTAGESPNSETSVISIASTDKKNEKTIEIQTLKLYPSMESDTAIDFRLTNRTSGTVTVSMIDIEVYDSNGDYLGIGTQFGSPLKSGEDEILKVIFRKMPTAKVKFWRAKLKTVTEEQNGPTDISSEYSLKPTEKQKLPVLK